MKVICPECNAELMHEIIDDGIRLYKVRDGEAIEISNKSNGSGRVFCSKDETHKISSDLMDKVIDITNDG